MAFEDEVMTALRDLTEGVRRLDAALELVREDLGTRFDGLRDDMMVTTAVAAGAEERGESTRQIVLYLLRREQELRRRVEQLERGGLTPP